MLKNLADNLLVFWKYGKLKLHWPALAELDEFGEPDFYASFDKNNAKFHKSCGNQFDNQKVRRIIEAETKSGESSTVATRSSLPNKKFGGRFCAICSEDDVDKNLHSAGSFHATQKHVNDKHNEEQTAKWKEMALKLENSFLLNLLSTGSLASNELYYHIECRNNMVRNYQKLIEGDSPGMENKWKKAVVFDRIVSDVLDTEAENPGTPFSAKELNVRYVNLLESQGIKEKVNTTRFTEKLVKNIPDLHAETIDNKTKLLFQHKVNELVSNYIKCPDDFFMFIRTVAAPIRNEMAKHDNKFTGTFENFSQLGSVPISLLYLISTLIDGSSPTDNNFSQVTLSVAQIIMWNYRMPNKKANHAQLVKRRHMKKQETPMMIYIGLKIYSTSRSRNLIEMLYQLGLCISYDRVLEITKNIYENLRESYENNKFFFPNILKLGLFTVMLKDNIDMNSKSNFIQWHYHGTSRSIIQFRTHENRGEPFPKVDVSKSVESAKKSKKLSPLPSEYTTVIDQFRDRTKKEKLWAPMCNVNFCDITDFHELDLAISDEITWLTTVYDSLCSDGSENDKTCNGWAAHHASMKRGHHYPPGINTISPLIRDKVATLNTQGHCMLENIKSTAVINPGQTPVDVSDQPVFALTKELQYRFPWLFKDYFPLFGGLHIEQSLLVVHGQLIDGSGLLEILNLQKLSTIGLSTVVEVSSIKRAIYCIQVTVSTLFIKLKEAVAIDNPNSLSPYDWLASKSSESEMCFYWKIVLDFELTILIFIRSEREGNYNLYKIALRKLIKWYFIFGKIHYARWLLIHLFDLMTLEDMFPDIYENFAAGFFSFQKSDNQFSQMALDQVHEQNNRTIRSCGGATDLVNKVEESALIRWETCGPDVARLLTEFEESMKPEISEQDESILHLHHEDSPAYRKKFSSDVKIMCQSMSVNPFLQTKLMTINNSQLVPDSVYTTLKEIQDIGEKQVVDFIQDRLIFQKTSVCETIPKNEFNIWHTKEIDAGKPFAPTKSQITKMRSACENRPEIAKTIFGNEVFNVPQSLCTDVKTMYHGTKSDIVKRFTDSSIEEIPNCSENSVIIIEMSPLIRAKCSNSKDMTCFSDLAVVLYYEVIRLGLEHDRIDLIFDRYFDGSLKTETRESRGAGTTLLFDSNTEIPTDMTDNFLRNSENKNNLNEFLAKQIIDMHQEPKVIIATYRDTVLCSSPIDLSDGHRFPINNCESEEADQRVIRHTLHCMSEQYRRIVVRTIDTDVLILLMSYVAKYHEICGEGITVYAHMVNSSCEFYNITSAVESLGKETCSALPLFYALTGCDIVSSFFSKGKCKAWDTWQKSGQKDELTALFSKLGDKPAALVNDQIDLLETFVLELYGLSREDTLLQGRLNKFTMSTDDDLRKLPPGRDALTEHIKRACYQAGYLWRESSDNVSLPDPTLWGWKRNDNGQYEPLWETAPSQRSDFEKFISTCFCGAQKCNTCKCVKASIKCIINCACGRKCNNK